MISILDAINNKEINNVKKVVVISNTESRGLEIARDNYKIKTELLPNSNLNKFDYGDKLIKILKYNDITPNNGLICLAGFMKILGANIVNLYKYKILNIHPSLLPSFKGLHAQKQAIDAGVKISGCTVHFVDVGVDNGPIILQKSVPVFDNDDEVSLSNRILNEEHKAYKEAILLFIENRLRIGGNKVFIN